MRCSNFSNLFLE